jgi:hypothetical protein
MEELAVLFIIIPRLNAIVTVSPSLKEKPATNNVIVNPNVRMKESALRPTMEKKCAFVHQDTVEYTANIVCVSRPPATMEAIVLL